MTGTGGSKRAICGKDLQVYYDIPEGKLFRPALEMGRQHAENCSRFFVTNRRGYQLQALKYTKLEDFSTRQYAIEDLATFSTKEDEEVKTAILAYVNDPFPMVRNVARKFFEDLGVDISSSCRSDLGDPFANIRKQ